MDVSEVVTGLWHDYGDYIRKFCAYKLNSMPWCIEDCVQDVFLDLNIAVKNGREIKNYKAWLTAVANNKIKDIYRDSKRKADNVVPLTDELVNTIVDRSLESFDEPQIPEEQILQQKEDFLKSLSDDEYSLFRERFVLKKSCKEIALSCQTTESNVRKRIYRLRQKAKNMQRNLLLQK